MTHIFHLKADFINGATAILTTPSIRWCDLDSWTYYMGISSCCVCAVDDKRYDGRWYSTHFEKDTAGKYVITVGDDFFLSDLAKVWHVQIRK